MYDGSKVGLGICTYQRPDYFGVAAKSVEKHLLDVVDIIYVYDDGSAASYMHVYEDIFQALPEQFIVIRGHPNRGVAYAKNRLLEALMGEGCQYFLIMEDDQEILDPGAVTEYIDYSKKGKQYSHMAFAWHGPANEGGPNEVDSNGLEIFPNCVGAYTFFTREIIENVGYLNENYNRNAYEHVVYWAEAARQGYATAFWRFTDVPDSRRLLREQPGSIHNSAIRQGPHWPAIVAEERRKFAEEYPEVWT